MIIETDRLFLRNMDMPHFIFSVKRGEDKPDHIR